METKVIQTSNSFFYCDLKVEWLSKQTDTYLSNNIQNDLLKLTARRVLDEASSNIQKSTFISLMADKTTDAANKEQFVIVYRWVDDELVAIEEFVGLRGLKRADTRSIFYELTESMKDLHLDAHRMRGQCYDGVSTMSGTKNGVAKLITDIQPNAIYAHCYGHALNFTASDTVKRSNVMKNTLDTVHEICKLLKFSPKRDALLQQIKQDVQTDVPNVRVLCLTRWTVRVDSMKGVIENYIYLLELWDEAYEETKDTDAKARMMGVAVQMTLVSFIMEYH